MIWWLKGPTCKYSEIIQFKTLAQLTRDISKFLSFFFTIIYRASKSNDNICRFIKLAHQAVEKNKKEWIRKVSHAISNFKG